MDRNIILLFGGESNERLVSVASAQFMAQALNLAKLWYWHKNGAIYEVDYNDLLSHENPFTMEFIPKNEPIYLDINKAINSEQTINHTFVLALHGGKGENGYLQNILEKAGRPFTGSGAKASSLAFDKISTKNILETHQIRLAPDCLLKGKNREELLKEISDFMKIHEKAILKPVCGGSSLGCQAIKNTSHVEEAIKEVLANPKESYFLEKLIKGREITVGVIEDQNGLRALPCTEIVLNKGYEFDYNGKYLGLGNKEVTPAEIPEVLVRDCQRMAIAAHAALSLYGYSRTDIMVDEKGPIFLETNTLPGLTKASFIPQQLAAAQITMREFLFKQIDLSKKTRY